MKLTKGTLIDWGQQALLLITVTLLFWYLGTNAAENIAKLGITTGFDFLDERAGYDISFSLIDYSQNDTYLKAYYVGVANTLLVSFLSIILATVIGFIIGVGRVSNNWVVNRLCRSYVEFIRNVPLVVQLVWWYAIFLSLPAVRNSIQLGDNIYLSNRGLAIPHLSFSGWGGYVFLALLVSCCIAFCYRKMVIKKVQWVGFTPVLWPRLLAIIVSLPLLVVLVTLLSGNFDYSTPKLTGFNFQGGMIVIPELVALWIALSVYSASYIAEIVRGCIQSVAKGQHEAGKALGFNDSAIMWQLIVPQAIYPMVPQITSVYLNIIKNSSLGVVIGFMELVSSTGGTTLNNTGQAIECILIVMGTYCVFSLVTSLLMNWYNSHVAVGRK
ncbi:amino acid ABC transporter permease [Vibrio gazogenes]|uniref:Amino acid ABC transporter permease n=1 Tax=Vibrio gazogenes TaxID=687 RepID=A0A1Z2SCP3_VIBGA|nr:ABC transporter permease subunit [Vibrio gazogenes]ASA54891.1 amino acid ABC transporter permease [Vibrio gazogenes]